MEDMTGELQRGWCAQEVEHELPGLGVAWLQATPRAALNRASPPAVLRRLRVLSDRWRGARAVNLRQEPVPAAYRVCFRQIGLDPDITPTPIEAAVRARMLDGGFLSSGLLADVLTIATVDTGVPVWALDEDALCGPLGIRLSQPGELLASAHPGTALQDGRLVVADAERPVGVLFGELSGAHSVHSHTRTVRLFAVQVAGVPQLHVEEALWTCRLLLEDG
jgi:DNA/RNA-binding domain of Phe-tRNA-synthetase-like protein